jgi:hypothetical protein
MSRRRLLAAATSVAAAAALAALPGAASAAPDPVGCTPDIQYDPSIPTFKDVTGIDLSAGGTGTSARNKTNVLYQYGDALVAATADNPRVRIIAKNLGKTAQGDLDLKIYVAGTPQNIANLDGGRNDAAFWSGVRAGTISEEAGLAAVAERPAFGWITATPHGAEPAAGEAISRVMYELAARTDCDNVKRLQNLDFFLDQARNPDGRDQIMRYTPWGFDPNRDFGTQNQKENAQFIPEMNQYPGPFFIDAHQQSSGYFFPPNEDPVHHELSDFSLGFIQNTIGPTLQKAFNDQSGQYRNYNTYDLFTPEYGDSVPSLVMGAAGMTFEKGTSEVYGKQVYDHYLAIDQTMTLTSENKVSLMRAWVTQWQDAVDQGKSCKLQPNKLVSPLHTTIAQQPNTDVCGYYLRADTHEGDTVKLLTDLQKLGVHVYRLDDAVNVAGLHEFGKTDTSGTLAAGTYYVPMAQAQKHWIQAIMGENPFIPFAYYYDVVTWSYPLQRGLAGDGFLSQQLPAGTRMSELGTINAGGITSAVATPRVYAFDTDSMPALALVTELLDQGATVSRAATGFSAGGQTFVSGAALVDAGSVSTSALANLSVKRNTPVTGLEDYPSVARYAMAKPKIGIYAATDTVPDNPLTNRGYCGANQPTSALQSTSRTWCEAVFTLFDKDALPASMFVPVINGDLPNLATSGLTALINPGSTISGANATALQAFVNNGGRYIGYNANGITSARNAGLTALNTNSISGLTTPGATFDGTYDATNPVAWAFDQGGFIYRDGNGNPVIDPSTLGTGKAVVTYAGDPNHYGYQVNGSALIGRPAVVDQAFGSGHAILVGFDPFYRAWKEQDERLMLNAILYPTGAAIAPAARTTTTKVAEEPLPKTELPATGSETSSPTTGGDKDVVITVPKTQTRALKAAFTAAELPARWRAKARYGSAKRGYVSLTVHNVRGEDYHDREPYVTQIMSGLKSRDVQPYSAQL